MSVSKLISRLQDLIDTTDSDRDLFKRTMVPPGSAAAVEKVDLMFAASKAAYEQALLIVNEEL